MTTLPDARLLNPLVVSGLLAAALCAAAGLAVPPPEDGATATLLERLVHNPFVLVIGFVGLWALVYGTIQLWATGTTQAGGLAGWLSGQGGGREVPMPADPTLAAGLFAERWDHLVARRMAPMSYAVWVLPLLGFIGTVIGISDAIGGLGTVFADGDRQEALESVLGALRFAFDTTFAGLVLVIPVMALSTWIDLVGDRARDRAIGARFGAPSAA
ncbi:MotA/TolQ/ExbB proton channel family protein [Palleronia abyssalis]|uniref:MotA/TolQ/ExbB proton channel domain-containing protein n=1 Tax=Palleronia abyssalis TaxID=1501240 RepID=A0A2R8C1A1_9RHOB|nr:MotA/TolQ/ExbB proton channel family protein [Palleronia abyssalis]SPJ26191.1 hypothetical protein PAA8504_04047 [Palleronia abyssalis]